MHLLADASTLGTARTLGVPASALAGDIRATLARDDGMRDINRALAGLVQAHSSAWLRQAIEAGRDCDAVIVSGLAAFIGLSAAESLRVPAIGTMLIPITPTAAFASPFLPFTPPRFANHATHRLVNHAVWHTFRKATNAARADAGLPPCKHLSTTHPMLYGVSPALVPPPDDWPGNAHLTGQWIAPSADYAPDAGLRDFLDAGEPPVYLGFGSMAGFDTTRVMEALVGAVDGRRALFNPGWSGIDPTRLPENFHVVGDVPHGWLLPRTALAVHHGGSGTTHSAVRAGVPSVIVPFAGDQFFWGARLRDAGVMRHALKSRSLDARTLGDAIAFAESADARRNAAALATRMRGEDGLATAVGLVERYARTG